MGGMISKMNIHIFSFGKVFKLFAYFKKLGQAPSGAHPYLSFSDMLFF